ncbi:MAG: hypothetical protein IPJ30_14170 [Acidobacteria bacterium]|nr:hypothetical protein [Acidobacteriota bacterium]
MASTIGIDPVSVYDALGNRVAEKVDDVWQFVIYDAFGKLVAEYGGTVPQDEGGVKFYLQDWQGSVRAGLNAAGYVKSRTDHQAFGEPIASGIGLRTETQGFGAPAIRQGYGLTENDPATGLNHTWFRKNENRAGRWTSPDPYNGSASVGNPQSWNRYSYVESQPTNFVDPSGLLTIVVRCEPDTYEIRDGVLFIYAGHCRIEVYGNTIGGGVSTQPVEPVDRASVRTELDTRLNSASQMCKDAIAALALTNKSLLSTYDSAVFKADPNKPANSATTSWTSSSVTITTKNGTPDDFTGQLGWLIHELSHGAAKKGDEAIYNDLVKAKVSLTAVNDANGKIDYSATLSKFYNANC